MEANLDKKLEGRIFDLLEVRARVRLGQLVQLRRQSRSRSITLLHAAYEAGQLDIELADDIARQVGLGSATASPPDADGFGVLPHVGEAHGPSVDGLLDDDSMDSMPDVLELGSEDLSAIEESTELIGSFPGFDDGPPRPPGGLPAPVMSPPGLPPPTPGPPPVPPPHPPPRPARDTQELVALRQTDTPAQAPPDWSGPPPLVTPPALPLDAEETTPFGGRVSVYDQTVDGEEMSWSGDTEPPEGPSGSDVSMEDPAIPNPAERYALGEELGRGGMGMVLEAQDLALQRPVALKLLIDDEDHSLRLRFVDEARFTGQLQHPNLPPVYELGRLGDGRLFFAMKRIEGRTLRDIIEELRHGEQETTEQYRRVRLLTIFATICRAIAYAHSRGLMHRDLKPDNVMLGQFGEVTVMDWGLAKPFDAPERPAPAVVERSLSGPYSTRAGEVTGTPQYMPPEQAAGRIDELGPHSDIYSLGAMLYEMLTLEPPFDGTSARAIREAVVSARLVPPSERAPGRDIPLAVEQLCLRCLARAPAERPVDAAEVAEQIDRFLEGEQDRERKAGEREELLEGGRRAAEAYYARADSHRQLQNKTTLLRARSRSWAPEEERRALWAQEDAEEAASLEAGRLLSEALAAFHAALGVDGEHAGTKRALRELYYSAFEGAERDRDGLRMAHYEALVRAFDPDDDMLARLQGDGRLEIETSPRGLEATLAPYVLKDRQLRTGESKALGRTPTTVEPIQMGRYELRLKAPGLSERRVPLFISRQESLRIRVRLFPDAVVGVGYLHVPGGPARLGGDALAQLAGPARTVEVDDFFMAEQPVTAEAYFDFLLDLARTEGPEAARKRVPRATARGPALWPLAPDGAPLQIPERDEQGRPWNPRWPVVGVSSDDAEAYCRWLSAHTGEVHRLPTADEWEKAARGADGRYFPWGDSFEPSFCHMALSRSGPPSPAAGHFPADCSPYHVLGLAGGVSEWTGTWFDEEAGLKTVKGGHWSSSPAECRAASRFPQGTERVSSVLGFRVLREPPR